MAGDRRRSWRGEAWLAVGIGIVLALIAAFAPKPNYLTDRGVYERIGRELIIPDCSSLHCTRVLVAWLVEYLPGLSAFNWKLYAVVGNTAAALGVARLCVWFGLSVASSRIAAVLVAFGAGAQLTLFDPYTSDPFIYGVTPWVTLLLLEERVAAAGVVGTVGTLAKEFAAAPLWIFTLYAALARRWDLVLKGAIAASVATAAWLLLQLSLIFSQNYSFAGSPSSQLLEGGYLSRWLPALGPLRAIGALVLHLGPLGLLAATGVRRAPLALRRIALAAAPAALIFSYVQQPDRALWNFQFVLIPLAVASLHGAKRWQRAMFVASYAAVNLKAAADMPGARVLVLAAFVLCAAASVLIAWTTVGAARTSASEHDIETQSGPAPHRTTTRVIRLAAALSFIALGVALLMVVDVAMHRRVEEQSGLNIWGYRGVVAKQKAPNEIRVVVLGGSTVFGHAWAGSIPLFLQDYLNNARLRQGAGYNAAGPITVVNLATPYDRPPSFLQTLRDYDYLRYDAVCLYVGHDDPLPRGATVSGWRRQSLVFRVSGYLPILPSLVPWKDSLEASAGDGTGGDSGMIEAAIDAVIDDLLARGKKVMVATHPFIAGEESRRQDAMAAHLTARFGPHPGFAYRDLRRTVEPQVDLIEGDGVHATPLGNSRIAESVSQSLFRLLKP
jgi:hypothetical protein